MEKKQIFLEFKIIWKDEDMLEIKISASNGLYAGSTNVYDQALCLHEFSMNLNGYPRNNRTLFYDIGEKDGYAYFSMKYYTIDNFGHIGVEIYMESNVPTDYRYEEKNKLKIEIIVEPNSIDNFQKELLTMLNKKEGIAVLIGIK